MKKTISLVTLALVSLGCHNAENREKDKVISTRYIHKYGYDVSKSEWESSHCPGQVITSMKNGVTVTSSYENGILHGPTTYTFPHSHTRQSLEVYEQGELIKRVSYTIRGLPQEEELYLSPNKSKVTKWFAVGTPLSIETFEDGHLIEGEYKNALNENISRVNRGDGVRLVRNSDEKMIAKETYKEGLLIHRTTFYENGSPYCQMEIASGLLNGMKKVFSPSGDPLSIETYVNNVLHGPAAYFQNGSRYLEVSYQEGLKQGTERHYIDGETVIQEIAWSDGKLHGPTIVYADGISKTQWFYNNEKVSHHKYNNLCEQARIIASMNERSRSHSY
ncbi:MAG: toxin-antitoxin system YwqK family antitoxin [Simkaniaceae bacterium]|nr:toxin-antitoxin system YwqK family antitoxin [Simkaniaceae bacterium]